VLAIGPDLLTEARASGAALAALTTYSLESTRAICDAAERTGLPVIISAGASSFRSVGRDALAAAALAAAHRATVPVGVHLDHCTEPDVIQACIDLGYSSVMIDGSRLPFDENVAITRAIVERAHAAGVWVEGELGGLSGDEDASSQATPGSLTDPRRAEEFVTRTGLDALAPAVGTVHGFTSRPVQVDLTRLGRIAALTDVPLVLHGASGLSDQELIETVRVGVAKVNINAELRRVYLATLDDERRLGGDDILRLQSRAIEAMTAFVVEKLKLLAGVSPRPQPLS
jgi:ketose-bisphosphate aldolase